MHSSRLLQGFLAIGLSFASASDSSDVHQLTQATFPDFVETNKLVLAEFFAPWCGHCKALNPEYEEAATSLKEKDVKLVKIDCTEEPDLCQKYGVEGYPTLKVFHGPDGVSPYTGQRKAGAITSYMIKQSLPAVSILTQDTLRDFKTADKVVLVAFIAATDKSSNETYTEVAEKLRDTYLFGGCNDAAVAEAEGVVPPAIVLYKQFDEGRSNYAEKKFDAEKIEQFAKLSAVPLIGEVGPDTYATYMSAGIPLAYIFAETPEERQQLSNELRSVAEKFRGVVNFATIDAKNFGAHAGNLNLITDKFPAFAIQDTVKNLKYPLSQDEDFTVGRVVDFVDKYASGQMDPSIKSEPIPMTQNGPVTVVVARNYDTVVLDNKKDVLIEFYAPWCGHCKALAPKYDELAALYASSEFRDKVVIAKVDATLNDVPDDIAGFPTIKLYPAGAKDAPLTYTGARTIEDLAEFVKLNGKYQAGVLVSIKEDGAAQQTLADSIPPPKPHDHEHDYDNGDERVEL